MKRICYLLVWLLTGFTFAANENSYQNFYLICNGQTAGFHKIQLQPNLPVQNVSMPQTLQAETELKTPDLNFNQRFVCSIEVQF